MIKQTSNAENAMVKPFVTLIVNFKEKHIPEIIKNEINHIINKYRYEKNVVYNTLLNIEIIYDYYEKYIDAYEEYVIKIDQDEYIQGFRIRINPKEDIELNNFIKYSYDTIMYIYKEFSKIQDIKTLNYTTLISFRSTMEYNMNLYVKLNEIDFRTKNSISLNRIRNEKSLLTVPIKDKYDIESLYLLLI